MNLALNDKVIIVTGGAKGIGEGIANVLAAEAAVVVIVGRNEADNIKTLQAIEANNGRAFQVVAELSVPADCENAVKAVAEKFGRIDGLVNNAGVNDGVGLEKGNYTRFMESLHKPGALLFDGSFRIAIFKSKQRKYCKHHFQNCRNRPGQYIGLCSGQWRP